MLSYSIWWLIALWTCTVMTSASQNYNSLYNKAVSPELKKAIQKELPKEAKFFDELDCKFEKFVRCIIYFWGIEPSYYC